MIIEDKPVNVIRASVAESMKVGTESQIDCLIFTKPQSLEYEWISSDETILTVTESGKMTALKAGEAKVILMANGEAHAEYTVTVLPCEVHTHVEDAAIPPTCTETGLTAGVHCSLCGTILTPQEEIEMVPHTEVEDAAVEATATTFGLTAGSHCSVCGEVLVLQEYVSAQEYSIDQGENVTMQIGISSQSGAYAEVQLSYDTDVFEFISADGANVAPESGDGSFVFGNGISAIGRDTGSVTLKVKEDAAPGAYTVTGTVASCYDTEFEDAPAAIVGGTVNVICVHSNTTPVVTLEPTCTEEGTQYQKCDICGEQVGEEEGIPATGHGETVEKTVEPTCTEDGSVALYCTICDEIVEVKEVLEAFGHTVVTDESTEPTCTEAGMTEGSHCSVCNEVLVAQEEIAALGHTEVVDKGYPPTGTEEGLSDGKHCTVCGVITVEQKVLPARENGDVNGDGVINGKDNMLMMQYLAGWDVNIDLEFADLNGDGVVNGKDSMLLMQYLAGWDVTLK